MDLKIFSGEANKPLAEDIAGYLGLELSPMYFHPFPDGESKLRYGDSIRGKEIFIIQSLSPPDQDRNIMQLLKMIDAAKRAGVRHMCIVIPYMAYACQDGKERPREPITAKLIADLISAAAENVPYHVVALDLHSKQLEGYFPSITPLLVRYTFVSYFKEHFSLENLMVGAPDTNASKQARAVGRRLGNCPLVIIDKYRPQESKSKVLDVIGNPKGKRVLFVDDMVRGFGTLAGACEAVLDREAEEVYAFCTHGILCGNAIELVRDSRLKKLFITDTIRQDPEKFRQVGEGKIEVISVAPLLAKTILRIHNYDSVTHLFED